MRELVPEKVRSTDGLISAQRMLRLARAAGYSGSLRNLRGAVTNAKADWRRRRRGDRAWQAAPGEHLVIDWSERGRLHTAHAVLSAPVRLLPRTPIQQLVDHPQVAVNRRLAQRLAPCA